MENVDEPMNGQKDVDYCERNEMEENSNSKIRKMFTMKSKFGKKKINNLLVYQGKYGLPGKKEVNCNILEESGCEEVVMTKSFAERLELQKESTQLQAELWDGTLVPMEQSLVNFPIQI